MKKNSSRILISATSSNVGKTLFTSSLLEVLKFANTHSFKCGPDYIDPMYHEVVLGIPSKNLDPFFMDEDMLKASFLEDAGDINIIEGCMGLYDGLGVTKECSTYDVAKKLESPIVLLVDASKAGYSIVAQIKGFLALDEDSLIKGVILNRMSEGYYKKLAPVIEKECNVKPLGYIPTLKNAAFESRHLGLMSVEENNAKEIISAVSAVIKETVDVDGILEIAESAKPLIGGKTLSDYVERVSLDKRPLIAIAKDEAFNFLYKDNIAVLAMCGVDIEYFSPIHDKKIPSKASAMIIPGGYPELYAKELEENKSMMEDIREKIEDGMPVLAECGGFMYLCEGISVDENTHKMAGVLKGTAVNQKKLVRFGYVDISNGKYHLKGHEFHHFDVKNPGEAFDIKKASDESVKYKAMTTYKNVIAGFPHLFYLSDINFVKDFIDKAKNYE